MQKAAVWLAARAMGSCVAHYRCNGQLHGPPACDRKLCGSPCAMEVVWLGLRQTGSCVAPPVQWEVVWLGLRQTGSCVAPPVQWEVVWLGLRQTGSCVAPPVQWEVVWLGLRQTGSCVAHAWETGCCRCGRTAAAAVLQQLQLLCCNSRSCCAATAAAVVIVLAIAGVPVPEYPSSETLEARFLGQSPVLHMYDDSAMCAAGPDVLERGVNMVCIGTGAQYGMHWNGGAQFGMHWNGGPIWHAAQSHVAYELLAPTSETRIRPARHVSELGQRVLTARQHLRRMWCQRVACHTAADRAVAAEGRAVAPREPGRSAVM
eukprot:366122-Chlamydomonas_euryale.AAC.2